MERMPGKVFDHLINDTVCIFREESETVVSLKASFSRISESQFGRVVKASDLKSDGFYPRRFKPCS